jgi:hypothetical protein
MIQDLDYGRMEFNPTSKQKLFIAYPKLKEIVGDIDDKSIRYILLMYDQNSPLRDQYPDLGRRKAFAAAIAGFKDNEDRIQELESFSRRRKTKSGDLAVNDKGEMVVEPCDDILDVLSNFLLYQNNRVWSMILANESAFYEYHRKVMVEVTDGGDKDVLQAVTIKTKLMESMDDIDKRLKVYYRELSGEDKYLEEHLTKRKKLSAESQAIR